MRNRLVRRALTLLLTSTLSLALGVTAFAGPASAASSTACHDHPSPANCNGAEIDVNIFGDDPCFLDSYSLTWAHGYTGAHFIYSDLGWTFETWLDYSPSCQSNFTYTTVIGVSPVPYHVSNKVRRSSIDASGRPGADGGYLMEHGDWYYPTLWQSFASHLVYSPHNLVQGCLSTNSSDQIQCTTGGTFGDGYY